MALNIGLHAALMRAFRSVQIANDGEPVVGDIDSTSQGMRYVMALGGEYYRVCCPYCHEGRHRLWIHHRWGVGMPNLPNDKFWWAAHCYNEGCMRNPANRKDLITRVMRTVGREQLCITNVTRVQATVLPTGDVPLPGVCVPLLQLPCDHPAVRYVQSRGFTPEYLTNNYGVMLCTRADPGQNIAQDRIIAPVYINGIRVGWQGRYIGDLNWRLTQIPKYYTMKAFHKSQCLYDYDTAKHLPYCIAVEGITDAWALGAGAVALLGKTLSGCQYRLLSETWKKVVILLDADAYADSEMLYDRLKNTMQVVRVNLPPNADPAQTAMLDRDYLFDLIYATAQRQGVDLLS